MTRNRSTLGLYALTLGAFAIGTTEFVPVGLLPEIARDLHVSIPAAGFLVTGYALGVAIGAPVFTLALSRVNRKAVLMLMLLFFIAGNATAALANNYGLLLLARILAAFNHGTFFGVGAVVAEALVPKERSASAISTMFLGLTVALVMGVPFGAFVGQHFGWHAPFALIALIGVLALVGVWLFVPSIESRQRFLAAELRTLASGPVLLALLTTLLGFGGVFVLFTYISPLLEQVSGFSPPAVAALLVLFGVGTLAGNIVAGKAADRALGVTCLQRSADSRPSLRFQASCGRIVVSPSLRRLRSVSLASQRRRRSSCSSFARLAVRRILLRRRTSAHSILGTPPVRRLVRALLPKVFRFSGSD